MEGQKDQMKRLRKQIQELKLQAEADLLIKIYQARKKAECDQAREKALKKAEEGSKVPEDNRGIFGTIFHKIRGKNLPYSPSCLPPAAPQAECVHQVQEEYNQIEVMKINAEVEIEKRKLDLEEVKLSYSQRQADRDHEILILKMIHEFELKKLELQLKLNQPQ